jgi:hypothetical protein
MFSKIKYLLIAMISVPAFAQVECFVDGEPLVIEDYQKLVIVSEHWNDENIVYHSRTPVIDVDPCTDDDLQVSPSGGCEPAADKPLKED